MGSPLSLVSTSKLHSQKICRCGSGVCGMNACVFVSAGLSCLCTRACGGIQKADKFVIAYVGLSTAKVTRNMSVWGYDNGRRRS